MGILNNELYVGRLVWNKLRYVKDPVTGKRVSRSNPESEWTVHSVPEMRIVEQDLWDSAKERQASLAYPGVSTDRNSLNDLRRPRHLLSGLIKCDACGGGFSMISKNLLGCSTARNKATCENRLKIRRDVLEASVLSGLRSHLMEPELFEEFCAEFTREMNRARIERSSETVHRRSELERVQRDLDKAIQAILDGVPGSQLKERIGALENRKTELLKLIAVDMAPPPLLHPNMAAIYHRKISALHEALADEASRNAAVEVLRALVDEVRLVPEDRELAILLRGDLAAMLALAADQKKPGLLSEAGVYCGSAPPVSVVAGTGFEPVTFRL